MRVIDDGERVWTERLLGQTVGLVMSVEQARILSLILDDLERSGLVHGRTRDVVQDIQAEIEKAHQAVGLRAPRYPEWLGDDTITADVA